MVATTFTRARPVRPASAVRAPSVWRKRWADRAAMWRYHGRRAAYRGGRVLGRQLGVVWGRLAPASLSILGLGSLSAAAFQVGTIAGLVAAGMSFFVLEWRISR